MPSAEHPAAQPCCTPQLVCLPQPVTGSRRRRLWELPARAHCPVIGVCLPMPVLRRLADKALGGQVQGDDYELHSGAVHDSGSRSALAEALQRELEQRHAIALCRACALKSGEALAKGWRGGLAGDADGRWLSADRPCRQFLRPRSNARGEVDGSRGW